MAASPNLAFFSLATGRRQQSTTNRRCVEARDGSGIAPFGDKNVQPDPSEAMGRPQNSQVNLSMPPIKIVCI